jgi:hypothetical protein
VYDDITSSPTVPTAPVFTTPARSSGPSGPAIFSEDEIKSALSGLRGKDKQTPLSEPTPKEKSLHDKLIEEIQKKHGKGFLTFPNGVFVDKAKYGKGLFSAHRYSERRGILCKIPTVKNRQLTPELQQALETLINDQIIDDGDLNEDDKQYLHNFIIRTRTPVRPTMKARVDKMVNERKSQSENKNISKRVERFKILLGEMRAGNRENPELIKEFKKISNYLMSKDVFTIEQFKNIISVL